MNKLIILFGMGLSIFVLSSFINNLVAQNVSTNVSTPVGNLSTNVSNPVGNLSASNLSNATGGLTAFANQTLAELGQKLSTAIKAMNTTLLTENSSLSQLEKNTSGPDSKMLNKTQAAK